MAKIKYLKGSIPLIGHYHAIEYTFAWLPYLDRSASPRKWRWFSKYTRFWDTENYGQWKTTWTQPGHSTAPLIIDDGETKITVEPKIDVDNNNMQ